MKLNRIFFKCLAVGLIFSHAQISFANTVKELLFKEAKDQLVPGMLVYIATPGHTKMMSYGTTTLGKLDYPEVNDYFRIGSNTKSMIAAVIIQLAQENALSLDDHISKFLPNIPNGDVITLRLLMQNRSGLFNYTEDTDFIKAYTQNPSRIFTPKELLDMAFKNPVLFSPGEKFYYCNTNFILLGLVAEKIENKPLATIFETRLFKPLGMKHTYLPSESDTALKKPFTHGYLYGEPVHVFAALPYTETVRNDAKNGKIKPDDFTIQSESWAWSAGGVVSTAPDLAIWIKSLSEGKLFNKEYYQQWQHAFKRVAPDNVYVEYGYGMFMRTRGSKQPIYYHHGHLPGYHSYMIYDPIKKTTIIIWVNLAMSVDDHSPADSIAKIAVEQLLLK